MKTPPWSTKPTITFTKFTFVDSLHKNDLSLFPSFYLLIPNISENFLLQKWPFLFPKQNEKLIQNCFSSSHLNSTTLLVIFKSEFLCDWRNISAMLRLQFLYLTSYRTIFRLVGHWRCQEKNHFFCWLDFRMQELNGKKNLI